MQIIDYAKTHKRQIILWILLILIIIILSFKIRWNHPPQNSPIRTNLASNSQITQDFSLITEPTDGETQILNLIKNAKNSIDLVIYQMSDKNISDALIAAKNRGVDVRVLLNGGYFGKMEKSTISLEYQYLTKSGISVKYTPADFALTHQKTLVTDNTALIMTWNFTPTYYSTARDFGVIDQDQNDVSAIKQTFDADWNDEHIVSPLGDNLLWSPSAENDTLLLIKNAKQTLDIYNEEMNYDVITNALKDAVRRGVIVRVIMTYSTPNKPIFNDLISSGIQIHTFSGTKKLYIHAKVIVADNQDIFIGSQNFSYNSLNKNRELGLIFKNQNIISSVENTFATDWQNGKNYIFRN